MCAAHKTTSVSTCGVTSSEAARYSAKNNKYEGEFFHAIKKMELFTGYNGISWWNTGRVRWAKGAGKG